MKNHPFSQADLDQIAEAVRAAESKTSGEIVPYFVYQSDDYAIARWRGGASLSGIAMMVCLVVLMMSKTWIGIGLLEFSAIVLAAFLLGMVCVRVSAALKRLMLGHVLLEHRVSLRASAAFLSEEVFKTRERTGILLFVSFFERRVVILGDSGINAKVAQADWDAIVHSLVGKVKSGKTVDGLVDAIHQCGELLQKHGVQRQHDDTDELSDGLRIG